MAGGKWQAERSDVRAYLPCTSDVGPPRAALIRPVSILLGRVDRINGMSYRPAYTPGPGTA